MGLNVCECTGKAESHPGIRVSSQQLFVQLGSILGAMTVSRFVAITPWPGGE